MKQGLPIADSYITGIKMKQSELHIQNVWTEKGYTDKLNTKFYYFVFFCASERELTGPLILKNHNKQYKYETNYYLQAWTIKAQGQK